MEGSYVPEVGDVVWRHFNPQTGHDQGIRKKSGGGGSLGPVRGLAVVGALTQ